MIGEHVKTLKWYEQPTVKETISQYCRNRLVQLGSDPILRRYIDEAQTKPYWSPTPDEVVEWVREHGSPPQDIPPGFGEDAAV